MTITLDEFQSAVAERRRERKHGARKYEDELVLFALAHAREGEAAGRKLHAVATELGVTMSTLQSWQRRKLESRRAEAEAPRLRKVVVSEVRTNQASARSAASLTLTTSHGHTVCGLSVEQVVALLRGLS
jgi:hypothetical protein